MARSDESPTHLLLVRHGQSLYNRDGDAVAVDTGLTELGWNQAQRVADWLASHYEVDAVVSSPLERARQTADLIAGRLGLPVEVLPSLAEAEKAYWDELPLGRDADPLAYWDRCWQPSAENAPIYIAFRRQVRSALAELLARHRGETMVVVTHGGTIGTVLRSIFGGHQVPVFTENTGLTHLAWKGQRWHLMVHNSQAHLDQLAGLEPAGPGPSSQPGAARSDELQLHHIIERYDRQARAEAGEVPGPSPDLLALVRLAALPAAARVLDAATGMGAVAFAFAPYVDHVVGVDVSPAMLERAERTRQALNLDNVAFRWAEVSDLPFAADSFDAVTCRGFLHHTRTPEAVLLEFRRVLSTSGKLVLDQPVGSDDAVKRATFEAIEMRRDPTAVKVYSAGEIKKLLVGAGFQTETVETYDRPRQVGEWLREALADDSTATAVRNMLEASLANDAAGLRARADRDGAISFRETRVRLTAVPRELPAA